MNVALERLEKAIAWRMENNLPITEVVLSMGQYLSIIKHLNLVDIGGASGRTILGYPLSIGPVWEVR